MISVFNICFISTSAFTFRSIEGKVGGFVLVSNADAVDPDTPEGCDVAEIIKLYETGKVDFDTGYSVHFHICTCFDSWHDHVCYLRLLSLLFGPESLDSCRCSQKCGTHGISLLNYSSHAAAEVMQKIVMAMFSKQFVRKQLSYNLKLNMPYCVCIILADNEDPYRAVVRWYSRPQDVPKRSIRSLQLDSKVEIILDERPFDNDVSIETFFSNCVVSCGNIDTPG
jgi:hypothetical protein